MLLWSSLRIIFNTLVKMGTYNRLDNWFKWQVLIINKFNLRCYLSNSVMGLSKIVLLCLGNLIRCQEWIQWCSNSKCSIQCRCSSNIWVWTKCQWEACQVKECKCQVCSIQWWQINSDQFHLQILIIYNED